MKLNSDVKNNIYYVSGISIVLCAVMLAVFALTGYFSLRVLWGALLGTFIALLNFLLLAFTLNKAVNSESSGKALAALSYAGRNLLLLVLGVVSIVLLKVSPLSLLLPYVFPRLSIAFIHILEYRRKKGGK